MKDEWREKIANRLTPMHLYKLTPQTNCGECGLLTCLAFAAQAIVGQAQLDACPYLDQQALAPFRARLAEQLRSGIGVKREGFQKALEYLRSRLRECSFSDVAASVGAELVTVDGEPALEFDYFGRRITATKQSMADLSGEQLNPWEKIFLYNYIIDGAEQPSGIWIGMESLPNSVSKIKSLRAHCEARLAKEYGGNLTKLAEAVAGLGDDITASVEQADFAAQFQILPKLAIRVLWWAEDVEEGFESRVKFLFDSRVLGTLDLESLLFACEQLTDRLLEYNSTNWMEGDHE
ncbi:MAG: DUF3786 domain-containing protein [Desulforhabdus sp.]|jgi:hypothetical protein|nr:DUF3786 domain-containing protein [Desulforhabdus sp.]